MRRYRGLILAVAALAVIAIAHPWVVVPVGGNAAAPAAADAFDAKTYAAKMWPRIEAAKPVPPAGIKGDAATFVTGGGKVVKVDTASRAGLIQLSEADGSLVGVQVGPVVRGTALRDALHLSFSDFSSQIDFADAADALNTEALHRIAGLAVSPALVGKNLSFSGAATREPDGNLLVTPARLEAAP